MIEPIAAALGVARPVIESVVWCTLATVGPDGEPRTRIVHPVWDWDVGVGWLTSRPTPLRRRHLAHQPVVSLSYWSPAQDVAYVDAEARWVKGGAKAAVWARCLAEPLPMGFDPSSMFPDGPRSEGFAPIELVPHRIRVGLVADLGAGRPASIWTRSRRSDSLATCRPQ